MDRREKQLLAMLSASTAGERANAVERLFALQQAQQPPRAMSDYIIEYEKAQEEAAKLAALVTRLQAANERWRKLFVGKEALANLCRRLREWFAFHRRAAIGGAVLLVGGALAFNFYGPGTGPAAVAQRAAEDATFHRIAASWQWGEGESEPRVMTIAGRLFWIIGRGAAETGSHADANGAAVVLHCIHVYAAPAVSDYGAYLQPPLWWSPKGFVSWHERATDCSVAGTQKAEN